MWDYFSCWHNGDDMGERVIMKFEFDLTMEEYISILAALQTTLENKIRAFDKKYLPKDLMEDCENDICNLSEAYKKMRGETQ